MAEWRTDGSWRASGGGSSGTTWISDSGIIAGGSQTGVVDRLTGFLESPESEGFMVRPSGPAAAAPAQERGAAAAP